MKTCRRCNELKDESAFAKCKANASGLQSYCKACNASDKRERYGAKERAQRRSQLLRKYGLTHDAFEAMLRGQNFTCPICIEPFQLDDFKGPKGPVVDHCHQTGTVRGLLCQLCNKAHGLFKDDLAALQNAATYLTRSAA